MTEIKIDVTYFLQFQLSERIRRKVRLIIGIKYIIPSKESFDAFIFSFFIPLLIPLLEILIRKGAYLILAS